MTALSLTACVCSATAAAAAMWLLHRPRRRLSLRVRPYAITALVALGHVVDARSVAVAAGSDLHHGRAVRPVAGVARLLPRRSGPDDMALRARLIRSGRYDATADVVLEHRSRQLLAGLAGAVSAGVAAAVAGLPGVVVLVVGALGAAAGAARPTAAVDRATASRQARMRAELPVIAQLLALRIRAGGSVTAALATTADRCSGLIAVELGEALAQHRAGRSLDDVLDGLATATAEPEVARLHRLLAATVRYGLDAAPELRRLAHDGRTRELLRARGEATRRRAALLLPTIGLLAPQMLLFIAAPLPTLLRSIA